MKNDHSQERQSVTANIFYDLKGVRLDGVEISMDEFRGKVLLIVNTASRCSFTPQYRELEKLYIEFNPGGFEILGFPCNQFGGQEPGTSEEIRSFCSIDYDVTFPIFSKIDVNGSNAHPIFSYLKHQAKGIFGTESVKWNFTKFLLDRNGAVIGRYSPASPPESLRNEIMHLLRAR